MSENSFLTHAYLAILEIADDSRTSHDDPFLLKILSFLSFQVDQRMEKGMILHKNLPFQANGDPFQDSNNVASKPGKHQSTPYIQIDEDTSQ